MAMLVAAGVAWWSDGGRVTGVTGDPVSSAITEAGRAAQPQVAIKAFEALGDDPQVALLAQGQSADLLTDLSKVSGLFVIVASPSIVQSGGPTPAGARASAYVVSGPVQRVHERLRLQVHLTDAETGRLLWSERFDRPLTDFFAIQEELGPKILEVLPAKVSEAELRRVARRDTRNLEAYEHFQRGQSALLVQQRADNERAREMFGRAIALDATFARAYAGMALAYAADYRNEWTDDGATALDRAFELASTAYQINPDIAETNWVLAFVHMERRQHEEALKYLQAALAL